MGKFSLAAVGWVSANALKGRAATPDGRRYFRGTKVERKQIRYTGLGLGCLTIGTNSIGRLLITMIA